MVHNFDITLTRFVLFFYSAKDIGKPQESNHSCNGSSSGLCQVSVDSTTAYSATKTHRLKGVYIFLIVASVLVVVSIVGFVLIMRFVLKDKWRKIREYRFKKARKRAEMNTVEKDNAEDEIRQLRRKK